MPQNVRAHYLVLHKAGAFSMKEICCFRKMEKGNNGFLPAIHKQKAAQWPLSA
jgi:hypothetical protein